MKNIVIFASGEGTNAENLTRYFNSGTFAQVVAIFTSNPDAGVIHRAKKLQVPHVVFSRESISEVVPEVEKLNPDLIVLAGFLQKIPDSLIARFPNRIINIHPALLPKFGGKGMYGMNVHRAVLEAKSVETGITIHYVDANYDEGDIIFQKSVRLTGSESCEEISEKVRNLELEHFPKVVESILTQRP